jgi:BirA family biotin operon repressor/biotin-[acetyl-CoA-carboxylase] ligase
VTPPTETWTFDTRHVGRQVLVFDSLTSTNDTAADFDDGTLVVARHQTRGRGQHGRVWESRPKASLLASVALRPPAELNRPVILTAWAAVAVGDAIRELTGVQARIKWPNDLLVRGKKVCGILIEQRRATVVGFGLNLNQSHSDFTSANLLDATSLGILSNREFDLHTATETVVRKLDAEWSRLLDGERVPLESDWKWRFGLLGRHVVVELADGTHEAGRLLDLGFDGLELDQGDGAVRHVTPEFVRHIAPA